MYMMQWCWRWYCIKKIVWMIHLESLEWFIMYIVNKNNLNLFTPRQTRHKNTATITGIYSKFQWQQHFCSVIYYPTMPINLEMIFAMLEYVCVYICIYVYMYVCIYQNDLLIGKYILFFKLPSYIHPSTHACITPHRTAHTSSVRKKK